MDFKKFNLPEDETRPSAGPMMEDEEEKRRLKRMNRYEGLDEGDVYDIPRNGPRMNPEGEEEDPREVARRYELESKLPANRMGGLDFLGGTNRNMNDMANMSRGNFGKANSRMMPEDLMWKNRGK